MLLGELQDDLDDAAGGGRRSAAPQSDRHAPETAQEPHSVASISSASLMVPRLSASTLTLERARTHAQLLHGSERARGHCFSADLTSQPAVAA